VRAAYLVGADGSRSIVRHAIGVRFASEAVDPHPMITADVVVDGGHLCAFD
jgi:2-polyprenyl-6-methoxyphenol hydroxylase-like FAD-dependent oxidoreductase